MTLPVAPHSGFKSSGINSTDNALNALSNGVAITSVVTAHAEFQSQSVLIPNQSVLIPNQSVLIPNQSVLIPNQSVLIPNQSVLIQSQ